MDERSRSSKLRYVFLYYEYITILKVCGEFSVKISCCERSLQRNDFINEAISGYVFLYI